MKCKSTRFSGKNSGSGTTAWYWLNAAVACIIEISKRHWNIHYSSGHYRCYVTLVRNNEWEVLMGTCPLLRNARHRAMIWGALQKILYLADLAQKRLSLRMFSYLCTHLAVSARI